MSSEQQLADHWLKRNETLNAFILFEGGAPSGNASDHDGAL